MIHYYQETSSSLSFSSYGALTCPAGGTSQGDSTVPVLQKYTCIFLQSQLLVVNHTPILYRHLYPGKVLSYLCWYMERHHWWGLYSGSKRCYSALSFVKRAPACTLGNIFFVWAHSSLLDSGSDSDSRIQPAVLLLPRRPPPGNPA